MFFKYYNFFAVSFSELFTSLGLKVDPWTLKIILPIGISFYTFHGLSYVIDIYKRKIKPTKDLLQYSVFVSFFPLLVAGPIERATHLLPQIKKIRIFDYAKAVDGLRQILWGLFKKIVVADGVASYVNLIFDNFSSYSGSTLVLGAVLFAFQIYCDFSGYSDIAIGVARLFGIDLLRNFAFPYFSRDIAEFWRRWHISLTSWFKDYLYIPLGGSRGKTLSIVRNTFIVFIVSGFWHGANWTFIAWGALNALMFLPLFIFKRNRKNLDIVAQNRFFPSFREILNIGITFCLVSFGWIFFRSENIGSAFHYVSNIFSPTLFTLPEIFPINSILFILALLVIEWFGRDQQYAISNFGSKLPRLVRWIFYYGLLFAIFYFGGEKQPFIYFQF